MSNRHERSTRKATGGRIRRLRKPKKYQRGGEFTATTLGETTVETVDARGNEEKYRVKHADTVNLAVDGDVETVEIEAVLENPANPDYVRRDILTKGALVRTEKGTARITSRPGQDGAVNAVLAEEE